MPGIRNKTPGSGVGSGLGHWFCPYQLCDLGKVDSLLCVLLTCKMKVAVFTYCSCGIKTRSRREGLCLHLTHENAREVAALVIAIVVLILGVLD